MAKQYSYLPIFYDEQQFYKELEDATQVNSHIQARLRFLTSRALPRNMMWLHPLFEAGLEPNCEILYFNPLCKSKRRMPLLTACVIQMHINQWYEKETLGEIELIGSIIEQLIGEEEVLQKAFCMAAALGVNEIIYLLSPYISPPMILPTNIIPSQVTMVYHQPGNHIESDQGLMNAEVQKRFESAPPSSMPVDAGAKQAQLESGHCYLL